MRRQRPRHIFRKRRRGALSSSTGVWAADGEHQKASIACGACRSEEAEQFCQPCLRWVCAERCWPGDHFNQCWDCLPQRPQLKPNAEATNRWRIYTREMMRFQRTCWRYAYRQIVDKLIGARRVPPNDWPAGPTPSPSDLWDEYNLEIIACPGLLFRHSTPTPTPTLTPAPTQAAETEPLSPTQSAETEPECADISEHHGDYVHTDLLDAAEYLESLYLDGCFRCE